MSKLVIRQGLDLGANRNDELFDVADRVGIQSDVAGRDLRVLIIVVGVGVRLISIEHWLLIVINNYVFSIVII